MLQAVGVVPRSSPVKPGEESKNVSRCWRESLFFACAKKSNQKKAHPGGAPYALCATGSQAGSEFSEGTSVCRPKTARIVRAALRVLPILLAAPQGPRSNNDTSRSNNRLHLIREFLFPVPSFLFPVSP